jgi:hypothetical protein
MNTENNNKVEITVKTAWIALERLHDWLEWVDELDDATRRDIIALDELVRALDAEQYLADKRAESQARLQEANKKHLEAMKAKEEGTKN